MSAMPARVPIPRTTRTWRPRLHVVRNPVPSRSLLPYLLTCATILLGALVGALLLNTQMAVTAYELHDAQRELNQLVESEASLRQQVEVAGSPAELQRQATELGMVPAETIGFIDLAHGTVLGGPVGEGE
ncbi:hypothetical protein [Georgenia faecalis]|uniref:Cell division protein FtsL n=1 Tax=Georgenia faecalis TaxID=2483799 RepID=A0ABV9DC53_9MICO|nr:hypothetical protein [Georgenia faecalis]